jgi:hypothetical protein
VALTYKQAGPAGCIVEDDGERIAEIRSLRLVAGIFRSGGRPMIGATVPLPLYWMQYANHEHPERNAGHNGRVTLLSRHDNNIAIECSGTTASGSWKSTFVLVITRTMSPAGYQYDVDADLEIVSDYTVTPNPFHGELEFANLWPDDAFVTDPGKTKRYRACLVDTESAPLRIPHHHLESSDKHDIPLGPGDRFLWAPEDDNLCLTMESDRNVTAGLCAYMWDAHFGYKICHAGTPVTLPSGSRYHARYRITDIQRDEAEQLLAAATPRPAPDAHGTPVYVDGVNTFSAVLSSLEDDAAWPWDQEGEANFSLDADRGYDDSRSLRIDSSGSSPVCWKATTLGPAYGRPPFRPGFRYRLSGYVAARNLEGKARLAIRLHREGHGTVLDLNDYEVFTSIDTVTGTTEWTRLEVTTDRVSPSPDRFHLLLLQQGVGTTWFDNILLEELP